MIVYTAVFGEFDCLQPALAPCRHICYTDAKIEVAGCETVIVSRKFENPRKEARWYKTHSHILFDSPVSIWVDGHIRIRQPRFFRRYLKRYDIALHAHYQRDCIYEEGAFCVQAGKANLSVVNEQLSRYRREGYPEHNGLVETGLLVRRQGRSVEKLNSSWWEEMVQGSLRDQVSFNYVCWKLGMTYQVIPGKLHRNERLTKSGHG